MVPINGLGRIIERAGLAGVCSVLLYLMGWKLPEWGTQQVDRLVAAIAEVKKVTLEEGRRQSEEHRHLTEAFEKGRKP